MITTVRSVFVRAALLAAVACTLVIGGVCNQARGDNAPTGTVTFALLQVTFSDQTDSVHANSVAQLEQAGTEISTFYSRLSYGKVHLVLKPVRVKMTNTTSYYYGHCQIDTSLQYAASLSIGGNWNGHPAGYASGYDLMDSCYPCGISAYGLLGPPFVNDNRGAFPAWLDKSHVATVPIPTATPLGQSFVLPPLTPTIPNPVIQAVKVPIDSKRYYLVNGRSRTGADTEPHSDYTQQNGIFDQGVQIEYIDENADPPVTSCSGGGPGCSYVLTSTTYPYLLWHAGQTLTDSVNNIQIRTLATVTGGYQVGVDRKVPTQRPNLFITPWLTPPMNTYETVDIWVHLAPESAECGRTGLRARQLHAREGTASAG